MEKFENIWSRHKNDILIHSVFWVYISLQTISAISLSEESKYDLTMVWELILNMITFYSFYFLMMFIFPRTRSITFKILISLAGLGLLLLIRYELMYYYEIWAMNVPIEKMSSFSKSIHFHVRMVVITSIYAILIRFTSDWFKSQQLHADMINQKQASELSMLKSQISPHFFFNTLNNIYTLVYKKSDDAPEVIMKLSDIMRYMLYEANTDLVSLSIEVNYLKNYIELQLLRVRQNNFVEFNMEGDLNEKEIPPMLLIPFVENAFKHCDKSTSPCIFINLKTAKDYLYFVVTNFRKNSIDNIAKDKASGIGLQNVKRRLELLYPGKHKLKLIEEQDKYTVELILEI